MTMRRGVIGVAAVGGMLFGATQEASAQFGSLQRFLFRGTEYAGQNLFLSNPQGGPLFDYNQFVQRVEFNRAGDGYTYEFFKFVGTDSFGNPNTLDLGPFKIELGPDPALAQSQLTGYHGRMGYTTRFMPEVFFEGQTGERTRLTNFSGGPTSFVPSPVRYRVTFNAGVQDLAWLGNMHVDTTGRINAMGFYDFDMRLINVGSFEADGLIVQDQVVTDFDTGPINLSGNIGMDLLGSLFQADNAAAAATGPRIFSAAAQKWKTVDDLMAQLDAGEGLTDEEVRFLTEQMFISAFQADPLGIVTDGFPTEIPGFEGLSLLIADDGGGEAIPDVGETRAVPEPGTLMLLGLVAGAALLFRSGLGWRRGARPARD